jgi:hypothetical protein
MFELAGLSKFLDVFQKAFGLIEKRKDQKRKLFTEIVEPVYSELTVVVEEYYGFFRDCRDAFSRTEVENWRSVLSEKRKKREEIILARNRVLGITESFLSKQHGVKSKRKGDELLYEFTHAINLFFFASDDLGETRARSLFLYIEEAIAIHEMPVKEGIYFYLKDSLPEKNVVMYLERSLESLEDGWRDISEAYGDLRMFCLS